jgi:membrane-bound lytic murein transglycosylase A
MGVGRREPLIQRVSVDPRLVEIQFSDIEGWRDDDHSAALAVLLASAPLIATPPKTRALGIDGGMLAALLRRILADPPPADREGARLFLEQTFHPFRIGANGFVTGYYEPEIAASLTENERFRVPLYRRPRELVAVSETERPQGWDPEMRFARRTLQGFEPYFDRAEIEAGALRGRGLEIAFVEDPVDAFFIHVQGSARLTLAGWLTVL